MNSLLLVISLRQCHVGSDQQFISAFIQGDRHGFDSGPVVGSTVLP